MEKTIVLSQQEVASCIAQVIVEKTGADTVEVTMYANEAGELVTECVIGFDDAPANKELH